MNRLVARLAFGFILASGAGGHSLAQDLVISNARILVGDGQVIESGFVVVKDGRIVSVSAGAAPASATGEKVDGTGMSVMAGFIDVHRHLIQEPANRWFAETAATEMQQLLEAGFTTVQSGGDDTDAIVKLKTMVADGQIKGPRILAAGRARGVAAMKTEEEVRAAIRGVIAAGSDSIAEINYPVVANPFSPTELETRNLAIAIDEANKARVPLQIHAVSPAAMVAAVRAGGKKLIHTPHFGWVSDAEAKAVADAGATVSSCTGFGAPVFGVFNQENKPTFRDGKPWPEAILDGEGRGREAGYKPVNARTLFDNGVVFGFCTDTRYNATAALAQELKVLNLTFSPIDIVRIMGPNSAANLDRSDIGMVAPGKLGDLVVLAGNPLDGYWNLLSPVLVAKEGVVVVDKRAQLQSVRKLSR